MCLCSLYGRWPYLGGRGCKTGFGASPIFGLLKEEGTMRVDCSNLENETHLGTN